MKRPRGSLCLDTPNSNFPTGALGTVDSGGGADWLSDGYGCRVFCGKHQRGTENISVRSGHSDGDWTVPARQAGEWKFQNKWLTRPWRPVNSLCLSSPGQIEGFQKWMSMCTRNLENSIPGDIKKPLQPCADTAPPLSTGILFSVLFLQPVKTCCVLWLQSLLSILSARMVGHWPLTHSNRSLWRSTQSFILVTTTSRIPIRGPHLET